MPVFGKASKTNDKRHVQARGKPISEPKIPELDLSHLTQDEIAVIQHVLQKQKLFEKQTENKRIMIENQIRQHETRINNNIKKHLDLRLCRLCFHEKFGDGIGRVCHDCRRRVCYHCGSFYKPIESFSVEVKAKWRCRLCSLKREFLCMTGNWYHGDKARPALDAKTLESIEVVSDKEESRKSHSRKKSCAFHSSGVKSDTETLHPCTQGNRRKQLYHRRSCRRPEENLDMRYDPRMDDPRRRKRPYGRRRRRPGVISKNQVEVGRESSDTDGEPLHGRYHRRMTDSFRYPRLKEGYNNPQSGSPDSGMEISASDYHHHHHHPQQQQQQANKNSNCSALWQRRMSKSFEAEEDEETQQIPSIRIEKGSETGSSQMEFNEVEYVVLRKDFNDRSVRTRGFGMEIISGKMRPDGTLVTVVTRVVAGGPAHVQGNLKSGDQILEWNGHNLLDKTFEDACCILSEECEILKILVMRSRQHFRHNSVDRNRPMSLVDTEITARRKTIS
ncbi:regulating synaptic membrane exocytosis protein 2-like, partial [Anneissia japonica]|uniref:regulating synaptic membrane exocytosis protein 2-like n=1 Tax=Anneissia japonica TaxID=1529436 RepID=UPI00142594D0